MNRNRRIVLHTIGTGSAAWATGASAQAKLDEKEPQAVALGWCSAWAKKG